MDDVFKRRSVRRYTSENVSDELIKKVLDAGMCAPSAGNEQPWHFIVVRDKKTLGALSDSSPHAKMAKDAPLAIVVCADLNLEKHKGYWVQDCSAAVENILVEAAALGLGCVWLGIYPLEERVEFIRKQFDLPDNIIPFAIIPVGFPADERKASSRYNEERVHYERW